jgi:Carboxypeptidase regulatory-like domain
MQTISRSLGIFFSTLLIAGPALLLAPAARSQQTLGGIAGTVMDASGGALTDSQVVLVADATKLTRTQKTNSAGLYEFVNLPIGSYTLTFSRDGFETQKIPSIPVQADRTATVNVTLKVGQVGTTVTVEAAPLLNSEDTTNGYILEKNQIQEVPLPTGSFTGLAILSPGVNAELPSGTGANSGLGNQPIWANGQRDTSNSFLLNGVDASNLFNGKSTSQVASARVVNNTGVSGAASSSAAIIQSTASPYLAVGQSLPTPAPESVEELRVNTSMYDAQQGSTSGAHIDMSTASGTNNFHGSAYIHRGTNAMNAAPFFFNADPNIPANEKNPQLHRTVAGGTFGGPIIKDKLFGFVSYQHIHSSDQEIGLSRITVPAGLTDDRSPAALAALVNGQTSTDCPNLPCNFPYSVPMTGVVGTGTGEINPIAYNLLNYKLPNGQFLIPSADGQTPSVNFPENAVVPGTALFVANQAVANLDWNVSGKDTVYLKYYYQHDPTIAPYAYSSFAGFSQHLDAGSQVFSIGNTQTVKPNLSLSEVFGFIREKVYSTVDQPFTPQQMNINTFGSNIFPGITIVDNFGNEAPYNTGCPNADTISNPDGSTSCTISPAPIANAAGQFGQGAASQGAFTGVFQNRFMPSASAIWSIGRHTITFGGSYAYTQLNTRDLRTDNGIIGISDFSQFLQGNVVSYTPDGFVTTAYLQGDANRYLRAGQTGLYVQDKFALRSNLNITLGLRYDWNGGFKEKYGRLYNFDPSQYAFDGEEVTSTGFIVAGNNKFGSKGVSDSTLTGRQWGIAPRLGIAWSPDMFHGKVVVRAGAGIYYDRGELFTYLSPGFAAGVITGGPFGVNQAPPYVNSQVCSDLGQSYQDFIPTCSTSPNPSNPLNATGYSLANPWGSARQAGPSGNPQDIINYLPNVSAIEDGAQLFAFAVYDRNNKLPYSINDTLDIQWQPRNDLLIQVGYVGNLGRHLVIPVPFNQAQIASPSHPINGQVYSYGYTLLDNSGNPIALPDANGQSQGTYMFNYEGGNIDLRVPYVGYSSESESYKAAGISAYNALQAHVEKRLSHGLQAGFSYTYSHATDEQSALGLFYNGNNPLNLREAYGSADFDRTHVFNFNFVYQLPKFTADSASWKGRATNGWAIEGIGVFQSGQPFSVIDYSGAVGSVYYGVSDGITNPIVPLASNCTPRSAITGHDGATPGLPALEASCFTIPILPAGGLNGAIPSNDPYETDFTSGQRNIFRQSWQRRLDVSFVKDTYITERTDLKFSFDIFNITNTPSFDVPIDDVTQNQYYNGFPNTESGLPVLPSGCGSGSPVNGFYNCPFGLGNVNKTIGSSRQIQMMLRLTF